MVGGVAVPPYVIGDNRAISMPTDTGRDGQPGTFAGAMFAIAVEAGVTPSVVTLVLLSRRSEELTSRAREPSRSEARMTQLTAEELRTFPLKDTWTPEESLALYEITDGFEHIRGAATPQYVEMHADRVRWANAVRVASQSSGEPPSSALVGQTARVMFQDRLTYRE